MILYRTTLKKNNSLLKKREDLISLESDYEEDNSGSDGMFGVKEICDSN